MSARVPWPQWLTNSFLSANQTSQIDNDGSGYYASYTRLLYHLFGGIEGPFKISPQFYVPEVPGAGDATKVVAMLIVELNKHPVFFVEVDPPSSLRFDSKRKQADEQIRDRFHELCDNVITPRLPAISAIGTRIAFYEYNAATNALMPPAIVADPIVLNHLAPADRWNYNVLEADGIALMRQVAQDVK